MSRDDSRNQPARPADNVVDFIEYVIRNRKHQAFGFGSQDLIFVFGSDNVISLADRR